MSFDLDIGSTCSIKCLKGAKLKKNAENEAKCDIEGEWTNSLGTD